MVIVQENLDARAQRVHQEAIVVDNSVRALDYRRLQQGGVTGAIVAVTSHSMVNVDETLLRIMAYVEKVHAHSDELTIINSPDEIRAAKAAGMVGYIFQLQGMTEIGYRIYWVEMLARIGVRLMALTYNGGNQLGCACGDKEDTGLTYFGRQVVREMNRAGVVADLSHLGPRTAREVLEVSTEPVVISHSAAYDLVQNPRNAPTDLMKGVAERGGVMGIPTYAPAYIPLVDSLEAEFPSLETVLDHIDYAVQVMGVDHVGIGTDHSEVEDDRHLHYQMRQRDVLPPVLLRAPYLGKAYYHKVEGFRSAADIPKITRGLVARGYSDSDIKKIMGGNLLRVFDQVWGRKLKG